MSSISVSPVAALKGIVNDAGSAATLDIYTSPQPSPGGDPDTATLLASIDLSNPIGNITSDATYYILEFVLPNPGLAENTGTASWARIKNQSGNWVVDMDVTSSGGGGAITMNNTSVVAYATIEIMSGAIKIAK